MSKKKKGFVAADIAAVTFGVLMGGAFITGGLIALGGSAAAQGVLLAGATEIGASFVTGSIFGTLGVGYGHLAGKEYAESFDKEKRLITAPLHNFIHSRDCENLGEGCSINHPYARYILETIDEVYEGQVARIKKEDSWYAPQLITRSKLKLISEAELPAQKPGFS